MFFERGDKDSLEIHPVRDINKETFVGLNQGLAKVSTRFLTRLFHDHPNASLSTRVPALLETSRRDTSRSKRSKLLYGSGPLPAEEAVQITPIILSALLFPPRFSAPLLVLLIFLQQPPEKYRLSLSSSRFTFLRRKTRETPLRRPVSCPIETGTERERERGEKRRKKEETSPYLWI